MKSHQTCDFETMRREIEESGYYLLENVLDANFIHRAKKELSIAIEKEVEYHGSRDYKDYGMVLLCALYGGIFHDMLEYEPLIRPIEEILGSGCILYAHTSTSMPPGGGNYSARIHVDSPRIIPNYLSSIASLILLDDFTLENGASYYLPRSQYQIEAPTKEYFFSNAERLVAKGGSVLYWNPRLWHAGGKNETSLWRHALTIVMCRPYMKQRIDIPRALSHFDTSQLSSKVLQKLGFFSQVPANYDEYYVPSEKRKFRQAAE